MNKNTFTLIHPFLMPNPFYWTCFILLSFIFFTF
jgi:hypothetical protein